MTATPPIVITADAVLAFPASDQDAMRSWLSRAVGDRIMRDTYEVELVGDGRIIVRYFRQGPDGRRLVLDDAGNPVTDVATVDWPEPPPIKPVSVTVASATVSTKKVGKDGKADG